MTKEPFECTFAEGPLPKCDWIHELDDLPDGAIAIYVPAVPVPQPRQRHRVVQRKDGGKAFSQGYTPTKDPVNVFKSTVRMAAREVYQGPPLTGALRINCVFVLRREKSKMWKTREKPRYPHTVKPDIDNLMKPVLDALTGTVIAEDSLIWNGQITKWRAAGDEQPHCEITIIQE